MDLFIGSGPANGTIAPDFHFKNQLKETGKATFQKLSKESIATDKMDGQTWNWIDIDNDGDLDAFMCNFSGERKPGAVGMNNYLYRNDGDTLIRITEDPLTKELSVSLANMWADFDNDGDLDVIVGNTGTTNKYYKNNGDGTFEYIKNSPIEAAGAKTTWGMSNGDYDNDGDIDIIISNKTGYRAPGNGIGDVNHLYRNDLKNNNSWIIIKCIGTNSNKSAIGAIVKLTSTIDGKPVNQVRVIGTNNTFLGDNDIRAHFGLKNATTVSSIEIIWPSGKVDSYKNIKVNKILTATEGSEIK
jgi:hypothetical protein